MVNDTIIIIGTTCKSGEETLDHKHQTTNPPRKMSSFSNFNTKLSVGSSILAVLPEFQLECSCNVDFLSRRHFAK